MTFLYMIGNYSNKTKLLSPSPGLTAYNMSLPFPFLGFFFSLILSLNQRLSMVYLTVHYEP